MRAMSPYELTEYQNTCAYDAGRHPWRDEVYRPSRKSKTCEEMCCRGRAEPPPTCCLAQTRRTRTSSERSATESTGWRGG